MFVDPVVSTAPPVVSSVELKGISSHKIKSQSLAEDGAAALFVVAVGHGVICMACTMSKSAAVGSAVPA